MNTALTTVNQGQEAHLSIVPASIIDPIDATLEMLLLQVNSPMSRIAYASDIRIFRAWLDEQGITLAQFGYDDMTRYRAHLLDSYGKATAARRFVTMRRFLNVAVDRGVLVSNPVARVKSGIQTDDSSPHVALTKTEALKLLEVVDTSTLIGIRDYAILMLLLYCGIRRAECAAIKIGDIVAKMEHTVLTVQHGKGNKRRDIPLRPDVYRALKSYLTAMDRLNDSPDAYVFQGFSKNQYHAQHRISSRQLCNVVDGYARKAGLKCTPHDLRASFITFAIETGAPLIQVQRLVGHSSPITTERYFTRRMDLDNSAVYKIDLYS